MIFALVLACRSVDPELASRREALDAWKRGEASLSTDPVAAEAAFDEALRARPRDVLLIAWKAKAQAEQQRLDDAIATMDQALQRDPTFAVGRYDRAAWLARSGRAEDAAAELQIALEGDVGLRAADVLDDPDFAPYATHPAFAGVLPRHPLEVALDGPEGSVFLGSEFEVKLAVIGVPDDRPLDVTAEVVGPVRRIAVIEDDAPSTGGPMRSLVSRFVVTGAGEIRIGPVRVAAGPREGGNPDVRVVMAAAPPGKEGSGPSTVPLRSVRAVLADREAPGAWRDDTFLYVASGAADRVTLEPNVPADVTWELKRAGATAVRVGAYPAPAGTRVVVGRGGTPAFEGAP